MNKMLPTVTDQTQHLRTKYKYAVSKMLKPAMLMISAVTSMPDS